jgi:hypothetical protein
MAMQVGRTEEALGEMAKGAPEETEQVVVMEAAVAEEGRTAEEVQEGYKHRR